MRTILHIAAKDLLLRWRDRLGFFWWMIGFPLLIAVLIGTIFAGVVEGPLRPLEVAVVDEAGSADSREFLSILGDSQGVALKPLTEPQARDAVRRGELAAMVVVEAGFRLSPAALTGGSMPLSVAVDPTHRAELALLQAALQKAAVEFLRRQWLDPQRRPQLVETWLADTGQVSEVSPLERQALEAALAALDRFFISAGRGVTATTQAGAEEVSGMRVIALAEQRMLPASSFEVCFPLGILWGLLGLAAEFAMAVAKEREAGTLLRLRVAPIPWWHLLAGNGVACFVACIGVMLLLLAVGRLAFGVRLQNPAGLVLAIGCTAACFVGITMLLSVLGRTESAVGGGSWACLLVMAMLGGGMVPQIFMPPWMEAAGVVSPVTWAILGLEGGIWRGFSLGEMLKPCAVLLAQGGVFATIGAVITSRTQT